MPNVGVKLYSVYFKFLLKHRLQNRLQNPQQASDDTTTTSPSSSSSFGVTSRPDEDSIAAANPSFTDGVATKDIHIDTLTSLSVRIFLPDTCLLPSDSAFRSQNIKSRVFPDRQRESASTSVNNNNNNVNNNNNNNNNTRRNSYGSSINGVLTPRTEALRIQNNRRNSYGYASIDETDLKSENGVYGGYKPANTYGRKLPVVLQFHGGAFVTGSNDSVANDLFCRRIAKLLDVIVLAVGYRLAPESRYPAAFEDGLKVLQWLSKQSNLAECNKSLGNVRGSGPDIKKGEVQWHIADAFGASLVEPWLAAHGDPSRCVLLGVSCGGNIANYVAKKAVEAGKLLDPVKVVAQVLMYPFFIGSVPTRSEIKLANSYFYDKAMCTLAWKLFLPEEDYSLDHPAANPLVPGEGAPPLKHMPPTMTIVAEHDLMRDRAIRYTEELRKVNVDAPLLEYKDAVHEFATLGMLLTTPQAMACADDIAIWVKKYISLRGHEFSY